MTSRPLSSPAARGEKPLVLCVDDEPHVLEGLRDTLHRHFRVVVKDNGFEAFRILAEQPVEVMLSDMRMPSLDGATLLTMAREQAPDVTRMVLTGQADLADAMRAVNDGEIFRFLLKPCAPEALIAAFDAGVRQHRLITSEKELLSETLRGAVRALSEVLALASPEAFGRAARVRYYALALASAIECADVWHIETAALLSQIGAVSLDPSLTARLSRGEALDAAEVRQVEELPGVALELLEDIPRLDAVRDVLTNLAIGDHDVRTGLVPLGAKIVRIADDYDLLESQGAAPAAAIAAMRERGNRYDLDLLDQFAEALGVRQLEERVLPVTELEPGMILAEDVVSKANVLRLARGTTVSPTVLDRLAAMSREHVAPCLRVLVPATRRPAGDAEPV